MSGAARAAKSERAFRAGYEQAKCDAIDRCRVEKDGRGGADNAIDRCIRAIEPLDVRHALDVMSSAGHKPTTVEMTTDSTRTTAAAGQTGRAIFETAKAAADYSAFGDAWRTYEANTGFRDLSEHDRALIRVAFVSGWRAARMHASPGPSGAI